MKSWKRTFSFLGPRKNSSSDWIFLFLDAPSKSIAIPFFHRERFIPRAIFLFRIHFSCRYGNAMQEAGNLVVSDDEKSFYVMLHFLIQPFKVGNVRRRLSLSDGQIPTVGISLKAQTESKNGLLKGYLRNFNANQKDWRCWILYCSVLL